MAHKKIKGKQDAQIAGLYDLENTIGRGHFAVVKLARHVFTGEKVAVKVIDKTKLDEISKAHLFQEVRCMKLVQHPHVVRLYEVIDTQTRLYLILELGDGGDMYEYIMKHKGLSEDNARKYFKQIVEAISYCHNLHVVHRDLKPENVIFFEKTGIVKVTDFGFSNMFNPGKNLETSCGSLAYSAPEILLGDSYDPPAVDVWSLGVILYMLVCGEPPFQEANDSETLTMIMDCKYQIPNNVSPACKDLITRMLQREPSDRMPLDDIVHHPWLQSGEVISHIMLPLISREHVNEEDHNYLVNKMVEGNIATKEEILHSLEKNLYDHITATFYLLAERKLKRQHHEMHQHFMSVRKNSAPPETGGKPHLEPLALSPRDVEQVRPSDVPFLSAGKLSIDSQREKEQEKELRRPKTSFVTTLVSPPGLHPVSSSPTSSSGASSPEHRLFTPRKPSLIKEESFEDDFDEDDEEFDYDVDIRSAKSAESLDDNNLKSSSSHGSPMHRPHTDVLNPKRPLVSVASSPQLLNQICEEGESDEEDDFVPSSLHPPKYRLSRNSAASPEMVRKYEQRKKRGSGSRGTSCSSSDASDTDDTEGRSRKDKLKQNYIYRRDSSDHSSDTDGGPTGPTGGLGGGRGFAKGHGGQGGSGGGKGGGGGGGSKDHKDGQGGGGGSHQGGKRHRSNKTLHLNMCKNKDLNSALSNLSLSSLSSKSSLKYIVERSESDSENEVPTTAMNNGNKMETCDEIENLRNILKNKDNRATLKRHADSENGTKTASPHNQRKGGGNVCSADCAVSGSRERTIRHKIRVKMDINRNGYCKEQNNLKPLSVQTKCCSVV